MYTRMSAIQKAVICGLCVAFIGGAAVPSSTVFAASNADKAQAKELYKNAFSSYKSGNFIAAADGFISANKLSAVGNSSISIPQSFNIKSLNDTTGHSPPKSIS